MYKISSTFLVLALVCLSAWRGVAALKCRSCTNTNNCISDVETVESTDCGESVKDCYTKVDTDGNVSRGCKDDKVCESSNCQTCNDKDNCNTHLICKKCDSSTDPDCAQSPADLIKYNTVCESGSTKCIMHVKDKNVERRCFANTDSCPDEKTCKTCDTPICNVGIFPSDRLLCMHCNGENCNAFDKDTSPKPTSCVSYQVDDKCYTIGDNETSMVRGCLSDKEAKCSDANNKEKCTLCSENGCNVRLYQRPQKLKCVQCVSKKNDDECWKGQTDFKEDCKNTLLYTEEEQCFTQLMGSQVHRGCIKDRGTDLGDCSADKQCKTCSDTEGCNNKAITDATCVICRSDIDKNCKSLKSPNAGSECRNNATLNPNNPIECFTGTWNGVLIRGCLVDADERMQYVCKDAKNDQCKSCTGTNCNNNSISGATTTTISAVLLVAILTLGRLL